jgi:hypothetical protein
MGINIASFPYRLQIYSVPSENGTPHRDEKFWRKDDKRKLRGIKKHREILTQEKRDASLGCESSFSTYIKGTVPLY